MNLLCYQRRKTWEIRWLA